MLRSPGTRIVAGLLAAIPLAMQGQATPPARADVPVRSVVLYSSGVGYFEHAGTVRGSGSTEIRFKTDQINDVLKSLVLQDADGGRVTAITYPSRDPVAKTLKSFQVDITANPGIADLLNQVRGARVTVQLGAELLHGTVLGVEMRRRTIEKVAEPVTYPVLNILTGATIRAVDLLAVRGVTLDDAKLQDELARALVALSQARDQDKKPVTINYSGTGDRRLRIGYVVESPVWKTSYRLILDGKAARLQGWAIVENQTESDWSNVDLSLVSGRPISFSMDLYQPLYNTRPKVVAEQFANLKPQTYLDGVVTTGFAEPNSYGARAGNQPVVITGQSTGSMRQQVAFAVSALSAVDVTAINDNARWIEESTVASVAQARKLGDLFQYTVPSVTLGRQKSAMLPIVADSVHVDRVSIYNAAVLGASPLSGVRLRNTTGKHLLQGPITVIDGDRYAGDARIGDVPPGQDRLLSFGVDLDLLVNSSYANDTNLVTSARIVNGIMSIDRRLVRSQTYLIANKGDRDKTVVIEHPFTPGWALLDGAKPVETTETVRRFEVATVAGATASLPVREERRQVEKLMVGAAQLETLLSYERVGAIPQAVRDAISHAAELKRAMVATDRDIADHAKQVADITAEQGRIRDNMKTVSAGTPYYKRLLDKLNEQESTIERLQRERADLVKRRAAQQAELDNFVAGLTVGS